MGEEAEEANVAVVVEEAEEEKSTLTDTAAAVEP